MKVLFCTDGSKISFNALENFSAWINKKNVSVDTICAIDWSFLPMDSNIEEEGFTNACANVACGILNTSSKDIKEFGMTPDKSIKVCGSAVDSILEQLEKEKYDIVLMGSHGRKGIQKWLGSVSQDVLSDSSNNIYISKYRNKNKKILFPVDGSEQAYEGVRYFIENFDLKDKDIATCIVNEDPQMLFLDGQLDTNWQLEIEKNQQTYAANVIKKMTHLFEENNLTLSESVILRGNVSQKIIDFTLKNNVDLVCMTSRNLTRFQKFLLGSVSKRVLSNTPADVLIVKIESEALNKTALKE